MNIICFVGKWLCVHAVKGLSNIKNGKLLSRVDSMLECKWGTVISLLNYDFSNKVIKMIIPIDVLCIYELRFFC